MSDSLKKSSLILACPVISDLACDLGLTTRLPRHDEVWIDVGHRLTLNVCKPTSKYGHLVHLKVINGEYLYKYLGWDDKPPKYYGRHRDMVRDWVLGTIPSAHWKFYARNLEEAKEKMANE